MEGLEQRDGGPSHQQLAEELEPATLHRPSSEGLQGAGPPNEGLQGAGPPSEAPQGAGPTTGAEDIQEDNWHDLSEVARVEQSATPAELQKLQSEGDGPIPTMYRSILAEEPLAAEELAVGSKELRQLHQRRHAMGISE